METNPNRFIFLQSVCYKDKDPSHLSVHQLLQVIYNPPKVCSLRPNPSRIIKCNVEKIMTLFHSFDIILEPGEFGK